MKRIIINADDFGMSEIFNKSILELLRNKHITSTTVMIKRITDEQSKQLKELILMNDNENISVGLHLELNESSTCEDVQEQYEAFTNVLGFKPSHIDIHKGFEHTNLFEDIAHFSKQHKLPVRNMGYETNWYQSTDKECFLGTTQFSKIQQWVENLEDEKTYEILFHPGEYDPKCPSSLNKQREQDNKHIHKLNKLCELHNIKKISYHEI